MIESAEGPAAPIAPEPIVLSRPRWNSEDWWAVGIGALILLVAALATSSARPVDLDQRLQALHSAEAELDAAAASGEVDAKGLKNLRETVQQRKAGLASNPLKSCMALPAGWSTDPRAALRDKKGASLLPGLLTSFAVLLVLFTIGSTAIGRRFGEFVIGFSVVFLLATGAFILAGQDVVKHYNLEYALWALLVGLIISNTLGTPNWLLSAANTEFYIKTGLVLLGAEVLFHRLLVLGLPGIFVAWMVTPVVLITTYIFGQTVLKMESRSLNLVISADMSVCGVSAAIATGAACRAKKEELSLAIGLSLAFTVLMMIVQPAIIRATGMSDVLGGAWIGGTIDSTGAVAAAGGMLGETALQVATTVKMIQNILIGVVAFAVAVYWSTWVERSEAESRPGLGQIWDRFPRFILGFLFASLVFSWIGSRGPEGDACTEAIVKGTSLPLRSWLFCLAFVSIGLETNFRQLWPYLSTGKPLILYVCGQMLNLALTLFMAWLMFERIFPNAAVSLSR